MITSIAAANFKSLGEGVKLENLGPMTALVGPNGAGKSNIADVLRFVQESLTIGLEAAIQNRHGIRAVRRWSAGRPCNVSVCMGVRDDAMQGTYRFVLASDSTEDYRVQSEEAVVLPKGGRPTVSFRRAAKEWVQGPSDLRPKITPTNLAMGLVGGDERFAGLANGLRNTCIYSIFPDTLREPQKPDTVRPMRQHGENWATVLHLMGEGTMRTDLLAAMGKLTGDIDQLRVRQLGGYLNTEFRHRTERRRSKDRQKWFEGAQESDGTLRVAGIVTALLQDPPLTLVGIEEPELTVHVGAIPLLVDYLTQAARRSQVLVTTHSIEMLELLDVDSLRVVERRDGATTVGLVKAGQRDAIKKRLLTVGDVVAMEGGLKQEALPLSTPGRAVG